jgi:hypothetical protein
VLGWAAPRPWGAEDTGQPPTSISNTVVATTVILPASNLGFAGTAGCLIFASKHRHPHGLQMRER